MPWSIALQALLSIGAVSECHWKTLGLDRKMILSRILTLVSIATTPLVHQSLFAPQMCCEDGHCIVYCDLDGNIVVGTCNSSNLDGTGSCIENPQWDYCEYGYAPGDAISNERRTHP